jgi:hypothetical protein
MGFFDFLKNKIPEVDKINNEYLNVNGGIRLNEAQVDVMFIVKNNQVIYINDAASNLFRVDKDGDKKLDGRIVKFDYKSKNNSIVEVFIAFDESDSYTMFTMGVPTSERFNYVSKAVLKYFYEKNIPTVFKFTEEYELQFEHAFKLYQKEQQYFMVNNSQSKSFIIDRNRILRSYDKRNSVDGLKELFWK